MNYENKNQGYGNFGVISENYDSARLSYPEEVIDFCLSFVKEESSSILDLGCGTGISTRQLAERGKSIVGCDKDQKMIEIAFKYPAKNISYVVAVAEELPFGEEKFDLVTAFGAFHWFANEKALSEIKKVLRRGGAFCVVNKNDIGNFKQDYKNILKDVLKRDLPNIKKDYDPQKLLKEAGLSQIQQAKFKTGEFFPLPDTLLQIQSMSIWNLVPLELKTSTLQLLEKSYRSKLVNGFVERKLEISAIVGIK